MNIFSNIKWLSIEKFLRVTLNLILISYVTRTAEVEKFADWQFTLFLTQIIAQIASFNLAPVVLTKYGNKIREALASGIFIILAANLVLLVLGIVTLAYYELEVYFTIGLLGSLIAIPQLLRVRLENKLLQHNATIIEIISVLASLSVCSFFYNQDYEIIFILLIIPLEAFLATIGLLIISRDAKFFCVLDWKYVLELIRLGGWSSIPVILSIIQTRLDIFLLKGMIGDVDYASYVIVLRLYELMLFPALIVLNAFFPFVVRSRCKKRTFSLMSGIIMRFGILVSILFILALETAYRIIAGSFLLNSEIYFVLALGLFFIYSGSNAYHYYLLFSSLKKYVIRQLVVTCFSIVIFTFCVTSLGVLGALISVAIVQFFANIVIDFTRFGSQSYLRIRVYALMRIRSRDLLKVLYEKSTAN